MISTFRWLLHWLGQGLKLWLFAALASTCVLPFYLLIGLLDHGSYHFDELPLIGKIGISIRYVACYAIGVAVFTAILASQLKDHPLRPYASKKRTQMPDG